MTWIAHTGHAYDPYSDEAREKERYREEQEAKIERSLQKLRTGNSELTRAFQKANRKP